MNKNGRKKRKKTWSSKFFQAKIGFWNPWSYSYERHDYCRRLGYDILGLTELHNVQAQKRFSGKTWVHSAPAEIDENGKNADPAAGVAIMLSSRMANKMISSGHVGTRIAWARIAGPVCNIFYVVVYIPHKGRTTKPMAKDTIMQLKQLLRTVNRSDCIILGGDFNCQLPRNVEGCTGQWSMTQKMQKGHGQDIIDLMREHNLFAVDTLFKPKRKMWNGRYRYCNATYLPKDRKKRPTKLDYICVSDRWKSMVIDVKVRWGPAIHRFGQAFDHGLLSATWRWKTKKEKKPRRPDYTLMTKETWPDFDRALGIKLRQQRQQPTVCNAEDTASTSKDSNSTDLANEYASLTQCVYETICEVVPEKKWLRKNGRVVSEATKNLFERRAKEFQKHKPTRQRRKEWHKIINNACKNDYRKWVSNWVQAIEKADEKGDTKAIYKGVKALSGKPNGTTAKPTMRPTRDTTRHKAQHDDFKPSKISGSSGSEAKTETPAIASSGSEAEVVTQPIDSHGSTAVSGSEAVTGNAPIASSGSEADNGSKTANCEASGPGAPARIESAHELADAWQQFLEAKFAQTELEKLRRDFEALPESDDPESEMTREEFDEAVSLMKNSKTPGIDGIAAEVWKNSPTARDALFEFLQAVWKKETVPANLAVCVFVMLWKNKGSKNDLSKYRAIGLLNHAYKILSVILLKRLVSECSAFFSDWQAGFRSNRGCRDNIMLLRVLYDQIIRKDTKCVVTYIDYTAAFDSISHKFMDSTLAAAGASRKSRAIFRAIYSVATGVARARSTDGKYVFSGSFDIRRGVIQGDIISPILFILALDQLVQTVNKAGGKGAGLGVKCGRILKLSVLGYADDAALIEPCIEAMTDRLTAIADTSVELADMNVSIPKTFTQHIHRRSKIKVTDADAATVEKGYVHKCDFCTRRFKTGKAMHNHRASCVFNYDTTDEVYELERITDVFGHIDNRWFLVKWKGYEDMEWEREHLLTRDGCGDTIRSFWATSGRSPCEKFYPDPDGKHRCTICSRTYARAQDLKAHKTRTGHHEDKQTRVTRTAYRDAEEEKRKQMQQLLPKAKWGDQSVDNAWHFKYLGSIMQADGGQLKDIKTRIARARTRFGKLRHLWNDKTLHYNLRLRLYKSSVCSIMVYGSEAWKLDPEAVRKLNGANSQMMSVISGKTPHQEASPKWRSFDIVRWIRARRLAWLGHILRLGPERKIKQAVFEMFKHRSEGDLLMDAPQYNSWRHLCTQAQDRERWRVRVRAMKQLPIIRVTMGSHVEEEQTMAFTVST